MRCPFLRPVLALALCGASLSGHAESTDPVLSKAEQLLAQRQPKSAFDLLAPLEDERAGNPDYDYLLGMTALESGQAGIAAFAFERCLSVDPKNGPCRVQMARTHMALGENGSARLELETIRQSTPPTEVAGLVNQYLGALSEKERREKQRIGGWAQVGIGLDSNVSSTTPEKQIAIPLFGGLPFLLSGVSTQQSDNFAQVSAGGDLEYGLSPAWSLVADAGLNSRGYMDIDVFNSLSASVGAGVAYRAGYNSVVAKLQTEEYRLDNNPFRSLYGLLTQYQRSLSETAAFSAYVQASRLDYHLPGTPNADRYTIGTGYSRALDLPLQPVAYAGLYGGQELTDGRNEALSQDFYGLRLGGSFSVNKQLRATSSLSVEQRRFGDIDLLFRTVRKDTSADLSLGLIYQVDPKLSVRPVYTYSNNHSNIVLSDYDRHVVSIDFRYEM